MNSYDDWSYESEKLDSTNYDAIRPPRDPKPDDEQSYMDWCLGWYNDVVQFDQGCYGHLNQLVLYLTADVRYAMWHQASLNIQDSYLIGYLETCAEQACTVFRPWSVVW